MCVARARARPRPQMATCDRREPAGQHTRELMSRPLCDKKGAKGGDMNSTRKEPRAQAWLGFPIYNIVATKPTIKECSPPSRQMIELCARINTIDTTSGFTLLRENYRTATQHVGCLPAYRVTSTRVLLLSRANKGSCG